MVKFLRRISERYAKLGKGRKKKQVWRKPTGRDNKMREKRRGYPPLVSIGYRGEKVTRGNIEDKTPVMIYNVADLNKVTKENTALIAKVGKKKKLEILKKAEEMKIEIANVQNKLAKKLKGEKKK